MKNIRKLLLTLYWSFAPNNYSPGDPRAFPGVTMNSPEVISITVLQSFDFLDSRHHPGQFSKWRISCNLSQPRVDAGSS